MIDTKAESLMKMGGVIAILATTLAVADAATAINLNIGNASNNTFLGKLSNETVGQSFINDPINGTGASILLNDWTFKVNDSSGFSFPPPPLSGPATLTIYAGTGIGGTVIGSTATYTTASTFPENTATWTFAGGLTLIDNLTYTAAVTSSARLSFPASDANPYANGVATRSDGVDLSSFDTVFSANFTEATPVPFEFEASGGLLILGGGWLLHRHLKKVSK